MTPHYCFPHSHTSTLQKVVLNLTMFKLAHLPEQLSPKFWKLQSPMPRNPLFGLHPCYFHLASVIFPKYLNLWKGEICLLTKKLQTKIVIKTPYLVQEDKVAVIGSDKFCKILLISESDWQSLSSAGACGLWLGDCGRVEWRTECLGERHLREGGGQDAWIRCGSCTRLLDLIFGPSFKWLTDMRNPSFQVSQIKVKMMVWPITKLTKLSIRKPNKTFLPDF